MSMPEQRDHDDHRRAHSAPSHAPRKAETGPPPPKPHFAPEVARAMEWLEFVARDAHARVVLEVHEATIGWDGMPHHDAARERLVNVPKLCARGMGGPAATELAWGLAYLDVATDGVTVLSAFERRWGEVSERMPAGWMPARRQARRVS